MDLLEQINVQRHTLAKFQKSTFARNFWTIHCAKTRKKVVVDCHRVHAEAQIEFAHHNKCGN